MNKIKLHYDHRRKMRREHDSLRYGQLVFLSTLNVNNDPHNSVFSFARACPEETAIISINFHNNNTVYKLDLKNLLPIIDCDIHFNSVCYIEDWINETKGDFYFEGFGEKENERIRKQGVNGSSSSNGADSRMASGAVL